MKCLPIDVFVKLICCTYRPRSTCLEILLDMSKPLVPYNCLRLSTAGSKGPVRNFDPNILQCICRSCSWCKIHCSSIFYHILDQVLLSCFWFISRKTKLVLINQGENCESVLQQVTKRLLIELNISWNRAFMKIKKKNPKSLAV